MANDQDAGRADGPPGPPLDVEALKPRLAAALAEDVGPGDITSLALIAEDAVGTAVLAAREAGIICGLPLVQPILDLVDERCRFEQAVAEGTPVPAGHVIGRVGGPLRAILAAERTMLNFLQRLSGIATLTAEYVSACAGTGAVVVDTRKTTPGWRDLEKYAVRVGGGRNHRMGLYDAVLIKDNHIDGGRLSPADAVRRAGEAAPDAAFVEIEARSLEDLRACLAAEPDIVMADNFTVGVLREAVDLVRAHRSEGRGPLLEASGGVTLENVREVALAGVDRIAVGALTHSAPALDIAVDVVK